MKLFTAKNIGCAHKPTRKKKAAAREDSPVWLTITINWKEVTETTKAIIPTRCAERLLRILGEMTERC